MDKNGPKSVCPTDKTYLKLTVFLFLEENIFCGYSLEAPPWGASNEYPQHMYSSKNKKLYMYLIIWILFSARAMKSLSQDK